MAYASPAGADGVATASALLRWSTPGSHAAASNKQAVAQVPESVLKSGFPVAGSGCARARFLGRALAVKVWPANYDMTLA